MRLRCNIDERGRRVRGISGLVFLLFGAGLLAIGWPPDAWIWIIGMACILLGAFQLFEARAGWCALRAAGIRTPL